MYAITSKLIPCDWHCDATGFCRRDGMGLLMNFFQQASGETLHWRNNRQGFHL